MIGPGKGHNVKRFLEFFQKQSDHQLIYFSFNKGNHYSLADYSNIEVITFGRFPRFVKLILDKELDLIWVHNWCPMPLMMIILILKREKCVLNFNIWSEQIPKLSLKNTLIGRFYKYFMANADYIQCHWYSTFRYFENDKRLNPILVPWGLEKEYFDTKMSSNSSFTNEFLASLEPHKYRFFVPKSINAYNRHDLIIEASSCLINEGIQNFVVYFWIGNHVNKGLYRRHTRHIEKLGLSNVIKFVTHPFLPINDLKNIWLHMDCGLQLLDNDQLSTSILEPMLFKKEIIASDIYSYRSLNERIGLKFDLVPNQYAEIYVKMKEKISGQKTNSDELEKRSLFVNKTRQFEVNIVSMLEMFDKKANA